MNKLKKIKFKDFIKLQRGFDLPRKNIVEGPYPVVGSTSIIGYHNEFKVNPPGVITGRSGSLGKLQYINTKYWPHNTALWIKEFKGNNPKYIYYFLQTIHLEKFNAGAGVPTLNRNHLDNYDILIHEAIDQTKVASILSNYDDLIENNTKCIQLLEKTAKLIYDEWFVKFKFPDHEKVKMVYNQELKKKIPEGWHVKTIGDIFDVVLGGTPSRSKEEYWGGKIPWVNSGKVNELRIINESEMISELGLKKSATKIMPKRTTLLAITGATLGQVSITEIEVCANQSVVGIYDKNKLFSEYLYLKIKELIQEIIMKAGGGAQQHINKEIVSQTVLALPNNELIIQFNKIIRPLFDEIVNLMFKNQNLSKTRDLLLPKLINGDIDVSELDIDVSQVQA